ncbi:lytic transglycosylase domain-containing protein [Brevundimonas sp. NPDC092305]|uniref:lytic transglycosylase domain-containing protein n=1 Tax=Brevundimonas sp. NPDC092305 TaxID=3363957 RepID=UPI00382080DA
MAIALCAFAAASHAEEGSRRAPSALSAADRLSYTTAFDALRRGDLETARTAARQAQDRVLLGQVEFERLFHRDYTATYEELSAWLDEYADLPCARRVYDLAVSRRPDGAPDPRRPSGVIISSRTWAAVAQAGGNSTGDPAKAARVAYNDNDMFTAATVGEQLGDWWTVGLAQYRLGEFGKAKTAFQRVLDDPTEDGWVRAGAAFWAARAAGQSGQLDQVQPLLHRSASWPASFYGQIAMRQLGIEPTIENLGPTAYGEARPYQTAAYDEPVGVGADELDAFVREDAQARRTVAFYEVGRRSDARDELRVGIRAAVTDKGRQMWAALGRALGRGVVGADGDARRIDATLYPQPVIDPQGGFTIERSLVYAIARKETNFNARARSGAGAYGLMQVMPTTASELTNDRTFARNPTQLFDPAVNARLGQAYVTRVLAMPAINGDLLRAASSYNAGPGPMVKAVSQLGQNADPLLLIETIEVPQAREYVEKVVAAYWIYQRMNGRPLNTLDAVASGATLVPLALDYVAPPPQPVETAPVQLASVATTSGGQ